MIKILLAIVLAGSVYGAPLTGREIVAITVLAEARGEGEIGMSAVACVILQRSLDGGVSPDAVCLKKKQFSCWNSDDPQRKKLKSLLSSPSAKFALDLADRVYFDIKHHSEPGHKNRLNRSALGYANHYHTLTVNPYWSRGEKCVKIVGNHKFYRL